MFLEIALCDDNENDRQTLKSQIDQYMTSHNIIGNISLFSCGEDFLSSEPDKPYDIVFMDIYMKGMNGVDTVLEASSQNTFQLVFITVSQEHAIEAFSLDAAHYLVKPTTENTVEEAMKRCLSRIETNSIKYIDIKTDDGNVSIPTNQIIYIEVYNKTCIIHTKKSNFETKSSLDAIYKLLSDGTFMRAQRSFVVNMRFIDSFSFDHITLHGGTEIVPSRSNWNELKKQYHQFLFQLARKGRTI